MNEQRLYILGGDWQLRGYQDGVEMAYNWKTGTKRFVSGELLTAARMCDGKTDFASPAIPTLFGRLAALLAEEGIAEPCEAGRGLQEGQAYRRAKNVYIASLLFSITNRCNFRCLHCYVDAPTGRYGELSRENLKLLLDQFAEANVPNVALTGGEPFIRPDLQEFLFGLRDRRIGFSEVFTNAALLTGELLDKVEEAGFHPSFKVSFDCVGSHDHMRGVPGAEESTLRGIRLLIRRGYSVTIITTIDNQVMQNLGATLGCLPNWAWTAGGWPLPSKSGRGAAPGPRWSWTAWWPRSRTCSGAGTLWAVHSSSRCGSSGNFIPMGPLTAGQRAS